MISIFDITEHHEHELAYLRIKELTESNIAGNKVSFEINLTRDQVEKIVGIQGLHYTEDKGYTFAQLLDEIFSHNIEFVKKEAGDILWQLSGLCYVMGWELEDVAQTNLDKLASRKERNVIDGNGDNR